MIVRVEVGESGAKVTDLSCGASGLGGGERGLDERVDGDDVARRDYRRLWLLWAPGSHMGSQVVPEFEGQGLLVRCREGDAPDHKWDAAGTR